MSPPARPRAEPATDAADERAGEAEADRGEDPHRVGARQGEPCERADDQTPEREDEDEREHHRALGPQALEQAHPRRRVLVVVEDAGVVELLEQPEIVRRVLRRVVAGGRALAAGAAASAPAAAACRTAGSRSGPGRCRPASAARGSARRRCRARGSGSASLPQTRPLLDEAAVDHDEPDGGEEARDAGPGDCVDARRARPRSRADGRAAQADRDGQPRGHRVRPRQRKARESAGDEGDEHARR